MRFIIYLVILLNATIPVALAQSSNIFQLKMWVQWCEPAWFKPFSL